MDRSIWDFASRHAPVSSLAAREKISKENSLQRSLRSSPMCRERSAIISAELDLTHLEKPQRASARKIEARSTHERYMRSDVRSARFESRGEGTTARDRVGIAGERG